MFIHQSSACRRLTLDSLARALAQHRGRETALRIGSLVFAATGQAPDPAAERKARKLISELRLEGVAVCGHPDVGYWLAANDEELEECCRFLRARAMHSLTVESRMRRVALPALLNQMVIDECGRPATHQLTEVHTP